MRHFNREVGKERGKKGGRVDLRENLEIGALGLTGPGLGAWGVEGGSC